MPSYEFLPFAVGAVCAAAAVPAARVASRFTVKQPIAAEVAAEADVISAVLTDPAAFRTLVALNADDFVWPAHRDIWAAIQAQATPCWDAAEIAEAEKFGVDAVTIEVPVEELVATVRSAVPAEHRAVVDELAADAPDVGHLHAGAKVIAAAADRNTYVGASVIAPAENPTRETPLERVYAAPTTARTVLTAVIAGSGGALATWAAGSTLVAAAAVAVWVAVLTVIALIDYDTLYIDMRLFWSGTAAAAGVALLSAGAVDRVVPALGWGFGSALSMWFIGVVYQRIRGVNGLGSGDLFLTAPLLAIPILLGAEPLGAYWGLLGGMIAAIFVVGAGVITKRRARDAAFAFGPYLAAGWPFGWALYELLNR